MALTRARMHEHLEQLVQQRTEALTAEIAEHNRTEQALRATEGRLESILASITDVIWSISAQTHKLQYLNPSAERIYGRPKSDFFTNPALWFEVVVHPADRDLITQYSKNLFAGVAGSLEYRIVKPDGEVRWLYDRAQLVYDGAGAPLRIDGITADISERKSTHDKLKKALNEKEVLLKEVYHRVKNNLQVVSSLINLQARNTNNEETKNLLKQSADRITSMALLHEKLYQSKDLARIDFNAYVHSLVDHLLFAHGDHSGKIKISMGINDVFLDVDTAIPCGLIIHQ
jgi:PAS domain S-box-containing protein